MRLECINTPFQVDTNAIVIEYMNFGKKETQRPCLPHLFTILQRVCVSQKGVAMTPIFRYEHLRYKHLRYEHLGYEHFRLSMGSPMSSGDNICKHILLHRNEWIHLFPLSSSLNVFSHRKLTQNFFFFFEVFLNFPQSSFLFRRLEKK